MKLQKIKPNEEFYFEGHIFSIALIEGKAKFKYIRKHDGKAKKEPKPFTPPSKDEVMTYFFDKGYESFSGSKMWDYYNELGWKDKNGEQVKNWKAKAISTWFKETNKRAIKTEDAKPQLIL